MRNTKTDHPHTDRLKIATKILMYLGLIWIVAGGLIAAVVGVQQIESGRFLYGFGSLLVGATVLFSAWFMRHELTRE